ncbi:GGDEF domain-containing protein [Clostridium intestinale]|uniref:Diguanylate cyclase n=1 Tax=Clostridium intestinale URNW TaxID=1294142 RepID=U2NMN4_9CLOT|nr:diguanylate cyclase [Clostridium intestinale]ERK30423.1 diguanylate cyclase [Clostridium intestinale URNW]
MTLKTLDANTVSLIILVFIFLNIRSSSENISMQYKLFKAMILANIGMIIIDAFAWKFNGLKGSMNLTLNTGFNFLLYVLEPIPPSLSVLYTRYHVFSSDVKVKEKRKILMVFLLLNLMICIISLFTGSFFYVDQNNIYHRGPYFALHVAYCYGLLIYCLIFLIKNKQFIEKRKYISMLIYFIPMAIGTTIQVLFYGYSLNWVGMMLSLLIIYFNIQNRGINTDYLTGIYNRRQFDEYIKERIKNSTENKSFSAILLDLNEFKSINDRFGHKIGDEALKDSVEIIRRSLNTDDFIARFGGDEFVIITDIYNEQTLDKVVNRIRKNVETFNINNLKPYNINFSIGYDIYSCNSKMEADEFFKHIDMLMYENKKVSYIETQNYET